MRGDEVKSPTFLWARRLLVSVVCVLCALMWPALGAVPHVGHCASRGQKFPFSTTAACGR